LELILMARISVTDTNTWKALIRKAGWPTASKTFRLKRDAEDWARRTEDEMVRGASIQRSGAERMTLEMALKRYLSEISPTKRPTTQRAEATKARQLISHLGKYSMAALSAEIIAKYRDTRLASITNRGNPTSNNTVRLELALLHDKVSKGNLVALSLGRALPSRLRRSSTAAASLTGMA
jgi:hypothetical protein